MKKTATPLLLVLIAALLLSSCIQTPDPETPKRIAFLLNVDNVGPRIKVNSDSVSITEVKFFADKVNLTLPDDVILQTTVDGLIMAYLNSYGGDNETVLATNIGYEDISQFKGTTLFVSPPQQGAMIQDSDFFGDDTTYALVMRGTYNEKTFTYKSTLSFEKSYDFDSTITLTNTDETLVIQTIYDMQDVLTDPQSGQLLDPTLEENKAVIDSLFKKAIRVEATAADVY